MEVSSFYRKKKRFFLKYITIVYASAIKKREFSKKTSLSQNQNIIESPLYGTKTFEFVQNYITAVNKRTIHALQPSFFLHI